MIRNVRAVAAGFGVLLVLTVAVALALRFFAPQLFSVDRGAPAMLLVLVLACLAIAATAGTAQAARMAPAFPQIPAWIVGGLAFLLALGATAVLWPEAPAWFHITAVLLPLVAAWPGSLLVWPQTSARL
ncbi:MAG TPA: hypothetical protein VME68_16020 [Acidobacteriaceae bacterium]|nr:hypothetical protein [Acidobacteriaceae bacterium]